MSNIMARKSNISSEMFQNILNIKVVRIYESNKTNFTDFNDNFDDFTYNGTCV